MTTVREHLKASSTQQADHHTRMAKHHLAMQKHHAALAEAMDGDAGEHHAALAQEHGGAAASHTESGEYCCECAKSLSGTHKGDEGADLTKTANGGAIAFDATTLGPIISKAVSDAIGGMLRPDSIRGVIPDAVRAVPRTGAPTPPALVNKVDIPVEFHELLKVGDSE